MRQRQHQQLEMNGAPDFIFRPDLKHPGGALLGDGRHLTAQRDAVVFGEEIEEIDATELCAKRLADAGAGETEAGCDGVNAFEDESVREDISDTRWLDLEAFGGKPFSAKAIPIRVKRFAGCLVHYPHFSGHFCRPLPRYPRMCQSGTGP